MIEFMLFGSYFGVIYFGIWLAYIWARNKRGKK